MKRGWIAGIALVVLVASAQAQIMGARVRTGYWFGNKFTGQSGKVKLEGPSLGLDIPVGLPIPLVNISFSPTIIWGGGLRQGNDSDGTIYKLMLTGRAHVPGQGFYGVFGVGYGGSSARGTTKFNTGAGFVTQFGIGWDVLKATPVVSPFVELGYSVGRNPYSGLSLEIGVRF
ncbi:MAG: hypothetical protein JST40_07735 [Armatimonadetes bacterium]|nr:hypothetical protein [Armatimonadota bacterium]